MRLIDRVVLREGVLVGCRDENWRIVHIEDMERVLAHRLKDGRHDFLPIGELVPPFGQNSPAKDGALDGDIPDRDSATLATGYMSRLLARKIRWLPAEGLLSETDENRRARAVSEFQDAVEVINAPRRERRRLIRAMCQRFGYNEATAYRRIKIVSLHGTADALMRAIRKGAGGYRISLEVQEVIRSHLQRHRFVLEPKTLPKILELVNGHCRSRGWQEVSLATLRNFEQETTLKKKLEAQGRKKKATDIFRSKVGHLPNNDYPLAIAQVDHTPIQVCLVDEVDRKPIGDAWLTLVIDTYSRMVLGFFLTFDPPSTLSTGLALAHAFLPKEEYLRSLGVNGSWPCWGFPDVILVDNAAELNGRMMHGARRRYRFTLRDRPVGAPNFGGHVESAFKTFMYEFKSLPGTKFSNPDERGEYDSEGRAIFTIREFEAFFVEFLVNDYHKSKHTGEGMEGWVPLLKWQKGVLEGDVMPPTGLPDRPPDPRALRISLMPYEMRTIRNGIVQLFDETYHSGALTLISDNVDLTKPVTERRFEIRYDPRDISRVWLYDEATDGYIDLDFADLRKDPISLWEHRARKRRREDLSEQFKDERYDSKLRREGMKESAKKRTKQRRLEEEKARQRSHDALIHPTSPPTKAQVPKRSSAIDPQRLEQLRQRIVANSQSSITAKGRKDGT